MLFVGVDLAWSENNPTGLATIEGDKNDGELISKDLVTSDEGYIMTPLRGGMKDKLEEIRSQKELGEF